MNTIRVSNNLDPGQARQNVGPDLGPNCLQGYQQMTKVATSAETVTITSKMTIWEGSKFFSFQINTFREGI